MRTASEISEELKRLVMINDVSMSYIAEKSRVNVVTVRRLVQGIGNGNLIYKTRFLLDAYLDKHVFYLTEEGK